MCDTSSATLTSRGLEVAAPVGSAMAMAPENQASAPIATGTGDTDVIPVIEETLIVSRRAHVTGKVRVSTRTETFDDVAEITLNRNVVDVSRVAIGRIVDVAPVVRTEGDTTIVPVIEERFVLVKQLYIKEELHIRNHVETEHSRTPVQLRRQVAVVERFDANGRAVNDDTPIPEYQPASKTDVTEG